MLAYVGASEVKSAPIEGWATFAVINELRPKGFRFAVVRRIPLYRGDPSPSKPLVEHGEPTGPFVVWDLDDLELKRGQRNGPDGLPNPPPPLYMGETEDGMVMKALSLYDR